MINALFRVSVLNVVSVQCVLLNEVLPATISNEHITLFRSTFFSSRRISDFITCLYTNPTVMKAVYFTLLFVSALACASAKSTGYDPFGEFARCYYTVRLLYCEHFGW